jgi:hypothetical protein
MCGWRRLGRVFVTSLTKRSKTEASLGYSHYRTDMNRTKLLSEIADDDLIRELARRLKRVATGAIGEPSVNAARLQMIRTLKSSSPQGQPLEILRFLVKRGTPETMASITDHMRTLGYKASRYYNASNALTDLRLAEVTQRGGEKSWFATQPGTDFLSAHRVPPTPRRSGGR